MFVRRVSRVARVGLMSGAVVTAIVVSGALPAAAVASTTSVVSAAPNGANADSGSYDSSVSADGRYVAFESDASNLVAGDTNGVSDVFVRDMSTGTVVRVSVDSAEAEGDATSYDPSISADGRYVAFWSNATNLVASDTNGFSDVFVRDRTLDTTVRVSVDSAESQGDLRSSYPSISADGRYVAFWSTATNLVAVDTNGFSDVFVRDLTDGTTVLVSVNSLGVQGNFGSFDPSISADGRYVAFDSAATNLTTVTDPPVSSCDADGPTYADDTLCFFDVFLAGSPAELPPTGGNPAGVVLVAVVLLGAGTCVLGLRRARTA